jgi:hypothetical protein
MAVLEDQVVEHILENATVHDVDSNYEAVIAGRAIPSPADELTPSVSADA